MPKTERYQVTWSRSATRDLVLLIDYAAANFGRGQAKNLHQDLRQRLGHLTLHPHRCRQLPELRELGLDYRELLVGNYRLPFRIVGDKVVVLGVLDGRRDLEELLIQRALDS